VSSLAALWRALGRLLGAETGELKGSLSSDATSASAAGVAIGDSADHAVITTVHVHGGDAGKLVQGLIARRSSGDNLPAGLPDFQGREDQIQKLKAILTGGGTAAVTAIGGMGGVGKSALALHAAHHLADAAPDARILVDMGGTSPQPLTPLAAMITVIQALQPEAQVPTEVGPAQRLYRNCLHGKRVLLLFDNAANSAQMAPLVEWRAPTTLVIVTSRQDITAPGLKSIRLDVMEPGEARDLLRVAMSERSASDAELDALSDRCGRLPLALRVAGTFLALNPDWSVAEYIEALADQRQRLAWLRIEDDARLNVQAVLGFSARKLAEDGSELFTHWQQLAVFPASFDRIAAAAVWSIEKDDARKGLGELLRRSMLMYDETDGRYRLHDLMRDVARLPSEGEDQATVEARLDEAAARQAQYYCMVLATADELYLKGGEHVFAGLALYDLEQRNIAAGQGWAVKCIEISDQASRLAAEYANVGAYVLSLRLTPRVRIGWFEAQLKACRTLGNRRDEVNALGNLGNAYNDLGEPRRAIEQFTQVLTIAHEIGDRGSEGITLNNLGNAYYELGEPRQAIEYYEQSLATKREIDDRRGEANSLGNLGNAYYSLGEARRAIEHYEQVLTIMREIGDRQGEANGVGNLGLAYAHLGEAGRAIEHYEQALTVAREIGDRQVEGNSLYNTAVAFDQLGERRKAIGRMEEALAIFEQFENPKAERARARLAKWRGEGG
jgi:tetratricopeptide (TPR) repeat protein